MFNIDFATLPEESKKHLAPEEIVTLNSLFSDPTIQKQLEDIEEQRKIRQKWKYAVYGGCSVLTLGLSFLLGNDENIFIKLLDGFFYTIGSGDNSFSPVIWTAIGSYSLGIGILYKKFASKIEIPLKSEVLSKMCPLLYSKLEYSYDEKHSFDELEILKTKEFLDSYDSLDRVEDSVHFNVEKDGKIFSVNGFELETSEMRGSGKNRRRVTTNHCYLMKAVFPYARIPLQDDLHILSDQADSNTSKKWFLPIFFALMGGIITMQLQFIFGRYNLNSIIWFGILGGIGIGIGTYYYRKKKHNENRIHLENIEFEKLFDVKCEDQITSRMILTPAFMDRIVQFIQKTGNQYEFIFQSNIMYVKRHIHGNYLEAGTEKNMLTNLRGFVQFYTDMREIISFTHDMNLMYLSKTTDQSGIINKETTLPTIIPIQMVKPSNNTNGFFSKITARFA